MVYSKNECEDERSMCVYVSSLNHIPSRFSQVSCLRIARTTQRFSRGCHLGSINVFFVCVCVCVCVRVHVRVCGQIGL